MTPEEYVRRVGGIIGDDLSDGEVNLRWSWNDKAEGKALIAKIRLTQKELRLLKKEVSAHVAAIKSEFTAARTAVGKTVTSGIAGMLFGRRNVGRVNAARRDDLRIGQVKAVAPYDGVRTLIERLLYQLDSIKGQIELSPEFQAEAAAPALAPPAPPQRETFYVFLAEEVKGPYTAEQLVTLADAGAIVADTQCCREGSENWTAYSTLRKA